MSHSPTTVAPTTTHAPESASEESRPLVTTEESRNLLGESLKGRARLYSVDILRGLVMVIMALDHVRDMFHSGALLFDPLDLRQTTPALFATRWITHFCAPVFVFLAGTGAFLSTSRGKTRKELAWFLLTRGLWLVLLELTLVRFGWVFNFDYSLVFALVIWALGWSMIVLAGLVFLPTWAITAFGLLLIGAHNAFDGVRAESFGSMRWLWVVLHEQNVLQPRPGMVVFVGYPLIPWIGVMATGYGFGKLLLHQHDGRRRWLLFLGVACILLFVVLRAGNFYGDPLPWSVKQDWLFTFFSFINTQKYPPSLLYLLMTLGPAFLALAFFDRRDAGEPGRLARPFIIFGRVPLFYYLLHIPLIHLLAVVFAYAEYGRASWLFQNWPPPGAPLIQPEGYGYRLPVVYLVWLLVVLMLYPLCRWFAGVKRRRKEAWLSYL